MRIVLKKAALALTLAVSPVLQGASHIASTATAREFLAGEARGTAVGSDGRLSLGAPMAPRVWPEEAADAVVFGAAADASGRVYVATGGGAGRLFVSAPDGTMSLLFTVPEPNLTAVAVAPDGAVIVGSSPDGKLYRVDPKAKGPNPGGPNSGATAAGQEWGDPQEAAIWALAFGPDGTLYVGTGSKGRLYRRPAAGKLEMHAEIEDTTVRSLIVGKDGTVYAGTSDHGLVVAVSPAGAVRTLHDFGRPEVVGLAVRADGTLYAAATSVELQSLGGPPLGAGARPPSSAAAATPAPPREEVPRGSVSVSVGPVRLAPSTAKEPPREGSGEIVILQPDGFAEPAWTLPDDTIYSLRLDGETLVMGTGGRGRVYSWQDRRLRLEAQTEQKQVVAALAVPGGVAAITMSSPGVFRPAAAKGAITGSYLAAVKDAGRLAVAGRLRHDSSVPAGASLAFSVRGGNSEKPDSTWSAWTPVGPDGAPKTAVPPARFLQWKVDLTSSPKGESPSIERVELSYADRNARPILEGLTVLEPGAVFPKSSGGSSTAVLSIANPDESGIYAGLEQPRDGGPDMPGKKLYRKGYRTFQWKGTDPNGDTLRYDVEARREGNAPWFPIRRDQEDSYLSIDTTSLPDGRYRFRVSASDRAANPEGQGLAASDETGVVVVDNTPPVLKIESQAVEKGEIVLRVSAVDALSPLARAEGSVNADRWRLLTPDDGVADGSTERYTLRIPKPDGPAVVSIRVLDAAGNVAAIATEASTGRKEAK